MPVVGCPKCQKKFKLAEEMMGKTVRCSQCQTKFKTAANEKASVNRSKKSKRLPVEGLDEPSQASSASLKKVGLSGPIQASDDLFQDAVSNRRGPDPLGNFSLEDPGFGDVNVVLKDDDDDGGATSDDKKHLLANPALKSIAAATKKKSQTKQLINKPPSFKEIKTLGHAITAIGGLGLVCYGLAVIVLVIVLVQSNGGSSEIDPKGTINIAFFSMISAMFLGVLTYLIGIFFWSMAHGNTTALGAKGQSYSPLWMVIAWFIPVLNLVWPMQGITEVFKASKRPVGEKWKKSKSSLWQAPAWTAAIILTIICSAVASAYANDTSNGRLVPLLFQTFAMLFSGLALFCIISMAITVVKTQYSHFSK